MKSQARPQQGTQQSKRRQRGACERLGKACSCVASLLQDGPKHMPLSLVAFLAAQQQDVWHANSVERLKTTFSRCEVGLHAISILNCVPMNLHYSTEYAYVLLLGCIQSVP